jgi:hypothetical protein
MGVRSISSRSAEISWDSLTRIAADKQIRCRRDYIVVQPLKVEHSAVIDVIEHTKPLRGIVKAVGPGHYPKRYDHWDKHRRTRVWDSPHFLPTQVKIGDIVELGSPQDARGYSFQSFLWGSALHVICSERDVAGVCCD